MKKILAALFTPVLLACATPAGATDLGGMTGIGYSNFAIGTDFLSVQSLSARHWLDNVNGVEVLLSYLRMKDGGSSGGGDDDEGGGSIGVGGKVTVLGVRYLRSMLSETFVNVYAGGQFEIAKLDSETGYGFEGFGGVEFFIPGVKNLGFTNEIGFQYLDLNDTTFYGFKGGSFVNLGVRYYFNLLN